jgi:hypothetical protein
MLEGFTDRGYQDTVTTGPFCNVFVRAMLNLKEDICLKAAVLLWKTWDARNKSNAGERMMRT